MNNSMSESCSLHQAAPYPESFPIEPNRIRERHSESHGNRDCSEERVAHAEAQTLEHLNPKQGKCKGEQSPGDLHTIINCPLCTLDVWKGMRSYVHICLNYYRVCWV